MSAIKIGKGYTPGVIGRVAELLGTYYHAHWGFGLFFEAKVVTGLAAFLKRYDESRDGFWTAALKAPLRSTAFMVKAMAPIFGGLSCQTFYPQITWIKTIKAFFCFKESVSICGICGP